MRLRTTLILLGLTLGLIGYIAFHERFLDNSKVAAEKQTRIADFDPGDINFVRLKRPVGEITFRKTRDGVWTMQSPLEDRADPRLIGELVAQAANLKIVDTIRPAELTDEESGSPLSPADLGFGDDAIAVTLSKGDDVVAEFTIGAATEMQDVSYVRRPGEWGKEDVYVVFSPLFETAALPAEKLRDPRLVSATADDLRQIKFAQAPTGLMLQRRLLPLLAGETAAPPGAWELVQPLATRADKQAVNDLVAALLAVSIVEFSDAPVPAPGANADLQDGRREIRVWTFSSKNKTIIHLIDSPEAEAGGYLLAHVSDRPGEMRISRDILKVFTVNPNELRNRSLADFEFDTVLTIDIDGVAPDGSETLPVKLARFGKNWAIDRNGRREKADAVKVKDFIDALNKETVEFASDVNANPEKFGLDPPLRLVTIKTEEPDPAAPAPAAGSPPKMLSETTALRVGEGEAGRFFANFSDAPFVYGVSPEFFGKIDIQPVRWKSPELLRFSLFDLKGISIRRPPQPPMELAYDPATNLWSATAAGKDVSGDLDMEKAREFGQTLSFLQCGGWTSDIAHPLQMIRDETLLDISIRIENRTEKKIDEVRVRIAPPSPGLVRSATYYGQLNEIPDVFLVPREEFDKLNVNLLKAPAPEPGKEPDSAAAPTEAPSVTAPPEP